MKDIYFSKYLSYCLQTERKSLEKEQLFSNMRRRKVKIVQVFCPQCTQIGLFIFEGPLSRTKSLNYCTSCGYHSALRNALSQLHRIARIRNFNSMALTSLKERFDESTIGALRADAYHLEVIALTSIMEVILRDFFNSLTYLKYAYSRHEYFDLIANESTRNDFMNISKANKHYKRALDIDLRRLIDTDDWLLLMDMTEIRNILIHNNGYVDNKFKKGTGYSRSRHLIKNNYVVLDSNTIDTFEKVILKITSAIINTFNSHFEERLHSCIANHYFNLCSFSDRETRWVVFPDMVYASKNNNNRRANLSLAFDVEYEFASANSEEELRQ
ncbi:MAG: hypothetical protein WDA02_04135 [Saccharofermentanales bacterium]